jgi:hypothetical protein
VKIKCKEQKSQPLFKPRNAVTAVKNKRTFTSFVLFSAGGSAVYSIPRISFPYSSGLFTVDTETKLYAILFSLFSECLGQRLCHPIVEVALFSATQNYTQSKRSKRTKLTLMASVQKDNWKLKNEAHLFWKKQTSTGGLPTFVALNLGTRCIVKRKTFPEHSHCEGLETTKRLCSLQPGWFVLDCHELLSFSLLTTS